MRLDGYESALLGRAGGVVPGVAPWLAQSAGALYAMGGLYSRVVDLPADTSVSQGVMVAGDDDGVIAAEYDRLGVVPALADGVRWSRLTGGGAIVLVADDGRLLNEPLDLNALQSIVELKVFDLDDVSAGDKRYSDPTLPNYGEPEIYRVRVSAPVQGFSNTYFLVHETRLIPIPGDPLPRQLTGIKGAAWAGRNAVDRAYPIISQYREALRWALGILERKQQAVYGMKGLAELILAEQESAVQRRIGLVDAVRSVRNTVAIDSEDSYKIEDTNLMGVSDIVREFQVALSAETGIPVTILFGRSPGGLNATGDADFAGLYDMCEGIQKNKMTPALERLTAIILAQRSVTKGPAEWTIYWPPLTSPSDAEQADARQKNANAEKAEAEALGAMVDRGLVSESEGHAFLVAEGRYGLATEEGSHAGATQYAQQMQ